MYLQKFEAYDSNGSVVAGDKVKEVILIGFIFVGGDANFYLTVLYLAFSLVWRVAKHPEFGHPISNMGKHIYQFEQS